jgi:hypothetical protein
MDYRSVNLFVGNVTSVTSRRHIRPIGLRAVGTNAGSMAGAGLGRAMIAQHIRWLLEVMLLLAMTGLLGT